MRRGALFTLSVHLFSFTYATLGPSDLLRLRRPFLRVSTFCSQKLKQAGHKRAYTDIYSHRYVSIRACVYLFYWSIGAVYVCHILVFQFAIHYIVLFLTTWAIWCGGLRWRPRGVEYVYLTLICELTVPRGGTCLIYSTFIFSCSLFSRDFFACMPIFVRGYVHGTKQYGFHAITVMLLIFRRLFQKNKF